jgi:hypothetical protein
MLHVLHTEISVSSKVPQFSCLSPPLRQHPQIRRAFSGKVDLGPVHGLAAGVRPAADQSCRLGRKKILSKDRHVAAPLNSEGEGARLKNQEGLSTELVVGTEDFVKRVPQLIKGDRNEQKPVQQLEECTGRLAKDYPGDSKSLERAIGNC